MSANRVWICPRCGANIEHEDEVWGGPDPIVFGGYQQYCEYCGWESQLSPVSWFGPGMFPPEREEATS